MRSILLRRPAVTLAGLLRRPAVTLAGLSLPVCEALPGSRLGHRASWDAVAPEYGCLLPDMSVDAPLDRLVLATFSEMLADRSEEFVAEVGCGTRRPEGGRDAGGLEPVWSLVRSRPLDRA
jgi:hypothetical protein